MFPFNSSELQPGDTGTLDHLVDFRNQYPDRDVAIERHFESVGSVDYNHRLSRPRAESVKSYRIYEGVASNRLSATGKGKSQPLVNNESDAGRQQNRRVELIIDNLPAASAASIH